MYDLLFLLLFNYIVVASGMRNFQRIKDHTLDAGTAGKTYVHDINTPELCAVKCQSTQHFCRAFTFEKPNVCKLHSGSTFIKGGFPTLKDYSELYQLGKIFTF